MYYISYSYAVDHYSLFFIVFYSKFLHIAWLNVNHGSHTFWLTICLLSMLNIIYCNKWAWKTHITIYLCDVLHPQLGWSQSCWLALSHCQCSKVNTTFTFNRDTFDMWDAFFFTHHCFLTVCLPVMLLPGYSRKQEDTEKSKGNFRNDLFVIFEPYQMQQIVQVLHEPETQCTCPEIAGANEKRRCCRLQRNMPH